MIDTVQLVPPSTGPQSNPLLFGVAEALALLFPVSDPHNLSLPARANPDSDAAKPKAASTD